MPRRPAAQRCGGKKVLGRQTSFGDLCYGDAISDAISDAFSSRGELGVQSGDAENGSTNGGTDDRQVRDGLRNGIDPRRPAAHRRGRFLEVFRLVQRRLRRPTSTLHHRTGYGLGHDVKEESSREHALFDERWRRIRGSRMTIRRFRNFSSAYI